jgi:peptidoglycan/xylan/chitin deacetylase (PgdA/CDA1 family)
MKAIMYHYVREAPEGLPYFRYLHVGDFARQLDWFAQSNRFVTRADLEAACRSGAMPQGIVLTFDDGIVDHHEYVMPLLRERGLVGFFYICTAHLEGREKLLDVHRIHFILGRLGGAQAMERLRQHVTDAMLVDSTRREFRQATYRNQLNDEATITFKRTLNYWISYEHRETILDLIFEEEFGNESDLAANFYLTPAQIRELDAAGMVVGSHGVNHYLFSKLPDEWQREEIQRSFHCLSSIIRKPVTTFCFPYGGGHAVTPYAISQLNQAGSEFSFDVNPRDITLDDLRNNRQTLPRYDCNMFPYGRASLGVARAIQESTDRGTL